MPLPPLITMYVLPGSVSASLSSDLIACLKHTYAESTKACYRTHLKSYSSFCTVLGIPLVPAEPHYVALYSILLARTLKYGSITQYLNIISLLHKSLDVASPLSSFLVQSTLRGIKHTIGHEPSVKLPVTPVILSNMLNNLDLSNYCLLYTSPSPRDTQ